MPRFPDPLGTVKAFLMEEGIRLPIEELKATLPRGARIWIIGGALRNALIEAIHGESSFTEDIDLFIENIDPEFRLPGLDLAGELRATELGGVRWLSGLSPYSFDIGLLSRFVIIDKFRLDPTPASLLSAIDFDVNAVMWGWEEEQVLEAGCVEAILRRVMDFGTTRVFDRAMLAYRILVVRHKTDFSLSPEIFHYLNTAVDLETLKRTEAMLVSKLGKPAADAIMKDCDAICRCGSHSEHCSRFGDE